MPREYPPPVLAHSENGEDVLNLRPDGEMMTTGYTDIPRLFALVRDAVEPPQIVGYGMEFPDGSAYSISWPTGRGASFYSSSSAEETATLREANVLWISDQP